MAGNAALAHSDLGLEGNLIRRAFAENPDMGVFVVGCSWQKGTNRQLGPRLGDPFRSRAAHALMTLNPVGTLRIYAAASILFAAAEAWRF